MCEENPPRFGKRCEHKCHCVNTSERCDQHSGVCQSGCISGWTGDSCQISKFLHVLIKYALFCLKVLVNFVIKLPFFIWIHLIFSGSIWILKHLYLCVSVTSVFDKSAVHVRLPSNETFQCSINKLWYNWTNVQLAFLNETNTFIMVTVSQDGSTSFTDPRISVSLSSGNAQIMWYSHLICRIIAVIWKDYMSAIFKWKTTSLHSLVIRQYSI